MNQCVRNMFSSQANFKNLLLPGQWLFKFFHNQTAVKTNFFMEIRKFLEFALIANVNVTLYLF